MDQITLRDDSEFLNVGNVDLEEAELSSAFKNGMDFNDPELMKEMEELCKSAIEDQTLLSNNMTGTVFLAANHLFSFFWKLVLSNIRKRAWKKSRPKRHQHCYKWRHQQLRTPSSRYARSRNVDHEQKCEP